MNTHTQLSKLMKRNGRYKIYPDIHQRNMGNHRLTRNKIKDCLHYVLSQSSDHVSSHITHIFKAGYLPTSSNKCLSVNCWIYNWHVYRQGQIKPSVLSRGARCVLIRVFYLSYSWCSSLWFDQRASSCIVTRKNTKTEEMKEAKQECTLIVKLSYLVAIGTGTLVRHTSLCL